MKEAARRGCLVADAANGSGTILMRITNSQKHLSKARTPSNERPWPAKQCAGQYAKIEISHLGRFKPAELRRWGSDNGVWAPFTHESELSTGYLFEIKL